MTVRHHCEQGINELQAAMQANHASSAQFLLTNANPTRFARPKKGNDVKERYIRNAKKVDAEIRSALIERMQQGFELVEEQKEIFEELERMFGDNNKWVPHPSPFMGVSMEVSAAMQKGESRGTRVMSFRGQNFADCTAEEATAWYFDYCSRERMLLDGEAGNFARLEIRKENILPNEKLVASGKNNKGN